MPSAPREQREPVRERTDGGRADARRVVQDPGGPVLIEGPVEVQLDDGTTARSDRPFVALCMCRRSRSYPWCDTSHRGLRRPPGPRARAAGDP
ncbi:CDGSH iron-sulfur domain-containing protein [Streptomyces albofaciens JCM 4342]|uniref:CDGSH iron-sulfur domain-containing protein n=1 Tax=Streptomyces albofaciens TaxID=66866 RepID=UPI001239322D|nr:CDGSH iron-sulfur domain-containing protein [Streptomyces albofaciens]KAA6213439.1 CDGSH iron-sulfur domain-containing protein [Streptomyces albofaciens JCM 4342]